MEPLIHKSGDDVHRIVFIEYDGDRPHSVLTTTNEQTPDYWDFNWCHADDAMVYHLSGGGGQIQACFGRAYSREHKVARFWADPSVQFVQHVQRHGKWITEPITLEEILRIHEGPRDHAFEPDWNLLQHVRLPDPLLIESPWGESQNPFDLAQDGRAIWCGRCDSNRVEDGWSPPCQHLYWCGHCASYFYTDTRKENDDDGHECRCSDAEIDT